MIKIFSCIIGILFCLFILYVNLSTTSTHYVCQENSTEKIPKQLFLTVEQHHSLRALWNNHNGEISYEIPLKEKGNYVYRIEDEGVKIYKATDNFEQGIYSKLKSMVTIKTSSGVFKGSCMLLNESCANNILH